MEKCHDWTTVATSTEGSSSEKNGKIWQKVLLKRCFSEVEAKFCSFSKVIEQNMVFQKQPFHNCSSGIRYCKKHQKSKVKPKTW